MTTGILGTGFYGRIRELRDAIRADHQQLENAPLGPIQRKRLQIAIDNRKAELKKVLTALKASKSKEKRENQRER
jgi:hypothetical protein